MKIEIEENELKKIIAFCDKRKYYRVTRGVLIKATENGAVLVATDGAILAKYESIGNISENWPADGVILFLQPIAKMLKEKESRNLTIEGEEGQNWFKITKADGSVLMAERAEARFPNYESVILPENTQKATVYQPVKWEYIKLAETVLNSDVYTIPKQQKPYGPMQWNRGGWTVVVLPLHG